MTTEVPQKSTDVEERGPGVNGARCQVILHNDNVNSADFVVLCLMNVFSHPPKLAWKIMSEAHHQGRAIAEVEPEPEARRHASELCRAGLKATVESF